MQTSLARRLARILGLALAALALALVPAAWAGGDDDDDRRGHKGHHGQGHGNKDKDKDKAKSKAGFRLTLLHNNDAESSLLTGNTTPNYGGSARFSTVVERLKDQARRSSKRTKAGTLMVSSGDNFLAGLNLNASFEKGVPWYDSIAFNRFGYDAATIGNHEFDFGPDGLADFIEGTDRRVPFLSANLDVSQEPRLRELAREGRIKPTTVVKRQGERIGVIGLTTPLLPTISSPRNATVSDQLAEIVNAEARRLERRGVEIIILSSHLQGIPSEQALVPELQGVDVVIAGGGDELLANPDDLLVPNSGDPAEGFPEPFGPYPITGTDSEGDEVPIVTTGGNLLYVGRLTAQFDRSGELTEVVDALSGPVRVSGREGDPDFAERDPYLVRRVETPLMEYREELENNVIATTEDPLDARNVAIRAGETGLGSLVADGFLFTLNQNAAAEGRPLADVVFTNAGGIRGNTLYPAGNITEAQTFDILAFDNLLVTVPDVSRAKFKELMEYGVGALPDANGRFPQIAGYTMVVDPGAPVGSRVRSITLADGTAIVANGALVDGPPVNIGTNNFTAGGGDGYPFGGAPFVSSSIPYQQGLFRYLTAADGLNGVVTNEQYPVGGDGRIDQTP